MLVDYEKVMLDLKKVIAAKPHHGQRELSVVIAQLEVQNRVEEGLPEKALRLYGLEFFEAVVLERRTPSSSEGRVPLMEGDQDRALRGDSIQSEEDVHVYGNSEDPRASSGVTASSGRARAGVVAVDAIAARRRRSA